MAGAVARGVASYSPINAHSRGARHPRSLIGPGAVTNMSGGQMVRSRQLLSVLSVGAADSVRRSHRGTIIDEVGATCELSPTEWELKCGILSIHILPLV